MCQRYARLGVLDDGDIVNYRIEQDKDMYTAYLPIACSINQKFAYRNFSLSDEYKAFKDNVDALWLKHKRNIKPIPKLMKGKRFLDKNVKCNIIIYDSDNRRDVDATVKVILDSLNGKFYNDDSQIWELHIQQNLSKEDPCVIVNLWECKRYKGEV